MSRFIVVVLVIGVLVYLANKYLLLGGDQRPGELATTGSSQSVAAENSDDANTDSDTNVTSVEENAESTESPIASESGASTKDQTNPSGDGARNEGSESRVASVEANEAKVMLGSDELVSGISGSGDLTEDEIEAWLANPANHVELKFELPLGLAAGAGGITGVDNNPLTRAKIELGRQLYFDKRLSADSTISCASCHAPTLGYAFNSRFGIGIDGQEGGRNSPVAYNRIVSGAQFWDGRADSLEVQAVGPIANPIEMGNTHELAVETLKGIPGYVSQFERVFDDGVTIDNVGKAIATFERTIVTGPAPWDHYEALAAFVEAWQIEEEFLEEFEEEEPEQYTKYVALKATSDANPITESAIRGGKLFFSDKAGCTACHVGANFTDEKYHNLGVGMDVDEPDLGRFAVSEKDADQGAFKTPTVRNVAMTAPYMHDGSQETLEEVIEWYVKGGHPNPWLSKDIRKLDLTEQDKLDLVEFMKQGLTGKLPKVETGRLPAS